MFSNSAIQTVQSDSIYRCQKQLCWLQENFSKSEAMHPLQLSPVLQQGMPAFTLAPTQTCLQ
jgi:hypothetical protein